MPRNTNTKRKRRVQAAATIVETSFTNQRKKNKLKHTAAAALFYVDDGTKTANINNNNKQLTVSYNQEKKKTIKRNTRNHNSLQIVPTEDLWGSDDTSSKKKLSNKTIIRNSFIPSFQEEERRKKAYNKARKLASRNEIAKRVPSIDVAGSGASYNPPVKEHKQLLNAAINVEVKRRKEIEDRKKRLNPPLPLLDHSLVEDDNEDDDDDNIEDGKSISINPPVKRENKHNRAKINKKKYLKLKAKELADKKNKKFLNHQLSHIKELTKEVVVNEKEVQKRREDIQRKKKISKESINPPVKRGGKTIENPFPIDVPLSDELHGSMRKIQAIGNPFRERMHKMMQRNLVEVGARRKQKKRRMKLRDRDKTWKLQPEEKRELVEE